MKSIAEIRRAYERNYRQMVELIEQMGGESQVRKHHERRTSLYEQLRELQQKEHYLNGLENGFLK